MSTALLQEGAEGREHGYEDIDKSFRFLVVEDDALTLRVVEKLLLKCNYQVVVATNGAEALEVLKQQEKIDLILTDIAMPELDGFELIEELAKDLRWRSIPVIVMSSQSSQEYILRAFKYGVCDYLIKPIRHNELTTLWQHVWRSGRGGGMSTSARLQQQATTSEAFGSSGRTRHASLELERPQEQGSSGGSTTMRETLLHNHHHNPHQQNSSASKAPQPGYPAGHPVHHHPQVSPQHVRPHKQRHMAGEYAGAEAAGSDTRSMPSSARQGATAASGRHPTDRSDYPEELSTGPQASSAAAAAAASRPAATNMRPDGGAADGGLALSEAQAWSLREAFHRDLALHHKQQQQQQTQQQQQHFGISNGSASASGSGSGSETAVAAGGDDREDNSNSLSGGGRDASASLMPSGSLGPTTPLEIQPLDLARPVTSKVDSGALIFLLAAATAASNGSPSDSCAAFADGPSPGALQIPLGLREIAELGRTRRKSEREQQKRDESASGGGGGSSGNASAPGGSGSGSAGGGGDFGPRQGSTWRGELKSSGSGSLRHSGLSSAFTSFAPPPLPVDSEVDGGDAASPIHRLRSEPLGGGSGRLHSGASGSLRSGGGPVQLFLSSRPSWESQGPSNASRMSPEDSGLGARNGSLPTDAAADSRAVAASNRQAALEKFRKKKFQRSFQKKVRYESRRRLAETRPRIRGQFVKAEAAAAYRAQQELDSQANGTSTAPEDSSTGGGSHPRDGASVAGTGAGIAGGRAKGSPVVGGSDGSANNGSGEDSTSGMAGLAEAGAAAAAVQSAAPRLTMAGIPKVGGLGIGPRAGAATGRGEARPGSGGGQRQRR